MKNVTAKIAFTLTDESGKTMHTSELTYHGLDEGRVLFVERHLLGALQGMNDEAKAEVEKAKSKQ